MSDLDDGRDHRLALGAELGRRPQNTLGFEDGLRRAQLRRRFNAFTAFPTLVKLAGRWQIMAKVFHFGVQSN